MKRANKDAISNSISYIENNLQDKLEMNELAEQIFFSKTHYQRLFQTVVGEPVMEYIKKRRLQQACQALLQTKTTILDIALQYGYTSHEGFTRAFKALYGMPPAQFRKKHASGLNQKSICQEVLDMLSCEVTKGITQHTQTIAEALAHFKVDLEKLCTSAEKAVKEAGPSGKGVLTVLCELNHLAAKTGAIIDSVKGFTGDGQTVFEVSDAIYNLLKHVDELAFQTNLLRFLSGIEVARTGVDTFSAYQNELKGLSDGLQKHHSTVTSILKGLISLLMADIRAESVRSLRSAAEIVTKAACKVSEETEIIRTGALKHPHGAGFVQITAEVKKRTAAVAEVAAVITRYVGRLEKGEASASDSLATLRAINSLKDIAFTMNLTAFNTAVETARAGGLKEFVDYTEHLVGYAGELHQTYTSCTELFSESAKLSSLLTKSREEHPESLPQMFQKVMNDIIFQGGILAMQLGMESERAQFATFQKHAKTAEEAVALLSKTRCGNMVQDLNALAVYVDAVSTLTRDCHTDADADMPRCMAFAYIAREFDVFVEKMRKALEDANQ